MALIWPDVVRFTIVGRYLGEDCMNILDIEVDDLGGELTPRDERIEGLAGDLINQWDDHILPVVSSLYSALEVRWVDLNSADGTTGARSATDVSTWPAPGGNPGPALPGNVYAKVTKRVAGKTRQQRNGVLRLGGIPEAATEATDSNRLTAGAVAEINTAFENLKDGINGESGGFDVNVGVLHTVANTATGFSVISTFGADEIVGTIRRRMPGYGD